MINKLAAVAAWILLAGVVFVTVSPISLRPETGHVFLERFLPFAALGAAFATGYPRHLPFAIGVTVLAAIGLEAAQLLVPGRHARVIDAGEKLAGGLAGLAIAAAFLALISRSGARRPA